MNVLRLLVVTLPFMIGGGIIFFFGWIFRLNQSFRTYDEVARRYHGTSKLRRMRPYVTFPYFGAVCSVGTRRRGSRICGRTTFVRLNWPDRRLILEIHSPAFGSSLSMFSRSVDVKTPDADFDRDFLARTNRPGSFEKLLSDNVRWRIREIARAAGRLPISVVIENGFLTVSRAGYLNAPQELDDFLRLSLQLADQFKLGQATGIDFVNENQATVLEDVLCPVCSELVAEDMVICVRCKTPHCRDCWEYNTHCATFACGEQRYFATNSATAQSQTAMHKIR